MLQLAVWIELMLLDWLHIPEKDLMRSRPVLFEINDAQTRARAKVVFERFRRHFK